MLLPVVRVISLLGAVRMAMFASVAVEKKIHRKQARRAT
jgi:hypothetical protein